MTCARIFVNCVKLIALPAYATAIKGLVLYTLPLLPARHFKMFHGDVELVRDEFYSISGTTPNFLLRVVWA